jgi:hypothetical protein
MLHDNDHKRAARKDKEINKLVPSTIGECAIGTAEGSPCSPAPVIAAMGAIVGADGPADAILGAAKSKTRCTTEKCVLKTLAPQLERTLGPQLVKGVLQNNFKIDGPRDASWLSNVNIDAVMAQWGTKFPGFYPWTFNMVNYKNYSFSDRGIVHAPDTLATVSFCDLYRGTCATVPGRYTHGGCVINADRYQGKGTHWMALFVDARNPRAPTVEFFNSSGNNPQPEYVNWMVKTDHCLRETIPGSRPKLINACRRRHQQTTSECGVYSLFYIWARLNGTPASYFLEKPIDDQLMFEFRHHLFAGPGQQEGAFDWEAFTSRVKVKWER